MFQSLPHSVFKCMLSFTELKRKRDNNVEILRMNSQNDTRNNAKKYSRQKPLIAINVLERVYLCSASVCVSQCLNIFSKCVCVCFKSAIFGMWFLPFTWIYVVRAHHEGRTKRMLIEFDGFCCCFFCVVVCA